VEETHKDAPNPGMRRVGYIRAAVEWEWEKEDNYNGKLTLNGSYFKGKDKQPGAKIHLGFDGHGPEPTTVNVQVGGN
jgi:hypothetical protein